MLFSRVIEEYKATDIVTYKLMENHSSIDNKIHSYSILKCYLNGSCDKIARMIKSSVAAILIWEDVKAGLQK